MAVGAEATDHARVWCVIDEEEFGQNFTQWTVVNTLAAPTLRAKAAANRVAAQLVRGATLPGEEQKVVAALKGKRAAKARAGEQNSAAELAVLDSGAVRAVYENYRASGPATWRGARGGTVVRVEGMCCTVTLHRTLTLLCGGRTKTDCCVNSGCPGWSSTARASW